MIETNYVPKLIEKALSKNISTMELYGIKDISALGLSLPSFLTSKQGTKHLVVVPSDDHIEKLEMSFKLLGFTDYCKWYSEEQSPYTTILTNRRSLARRFGFLAAAANNQHQVYICSAANLASKLSPGEFFSKNSFSIKKGDELGKDFIAKLKRLGFRDVHTVEDPSCFSVRGELIDLYSPNYDMPVRLELFDTELESIRFFDPQDQRSTKLVDTITITPTTNVLYDQLDLENFLDNWKNSCEKNDIDWSLKTDFVSKITKRLNFDGLQHLFPYAHNNSSNILSYFDNDYVWYFDGHDIQKNWDTTFLSRKSQYFSSEESELSPFFGDLFLEPQPLEQQGSTRIFMNSLRIEDEFGIPDSSSFEVPIRLSSSSHFVTGTKNPSRTLDTVKKIKTLRAQGYKILCMFHSNTQMERAKLTVTSEGLKYHQLKNIEEAESSLKSQEQSQDRISFAVGDFPVGIILEGDSLAIFTDQDFFGKKDRSGPIKRSGSLDSRTNQLKFSDLKPGDFFVHIQHGVGKYLGLETMQLQGAETEFVRLEYKDGDKLFIPVYKMGLLQKYSGTHSLDRLGSKSWENAKIKVKNALKDIADELIRLYAKRSEQKRESYGKPQDSYYEFEDQFPYTETDDQLVAIQDIKNDFLGDQPMDRLVCGDVGFGKTEVAMRAAFLALSHNKQVAILVPTTVLAFQHFENFKKRFRSWPFDIRSLGRFTPKKEIKETLEMIKMGSTDIVIGTHRLLSSDLDFAKLGLLIIDEEHRFGVTHKEKLKQLKSSIDCLSLSATPIPRTLNMALMGVRDLSVINTPPRDRLPIRTFINRFNKASIRKAILAEVERGGQIYFIHNRVQSIYARAAEIREIVPEASVEIAHGQMKDGELEKVMLRFFENKFNVLLCTTIVENGVDNSRANTMIIDNAQNFGLSQLYQLRGRVGRASDRAYCYLVIPQNMKLDPQAKERLEVIQENTALGSGFKIANHDLELRGAGNFLGAEQSGYANTVGYDLYVELLEQTLKEAKGEVTEELIEPEINLKIPALIPDQFIPDIRVRLSYYKQLSEIENVEQLEGIEDQLRDQFGKLPDELVNLMGIMLIRKHCRDLGIKEVSAGSVNLSLAFTTNTSIEVPKLVDMALKKPKLYRLTPESKLVVRMPEITWPTVLDFIKFLKTI